MEDKKTSIEIIDNVKLFLTQIPNLSYGSNLLQNFNQTEYGVGVAGYNILKKEFDELDFLAMTENIELENKNKKLKREIKELENNHTNLTAIIGDKLDGKEGSVAKEILMSLKKEIDILIEKRNKLTQEILESENLTRERITKLDEAEISQKNTYIKNAKELEENYLKETETMKASFESFKLETEKKTEFEIDSANKIIEETRSNANLRVKLINQFKDFLEETNKNMTLYSIAIIGLLITVILTVSISIPDLLKIFKNYDSFIKTQGVKITNIQIINYALGLLIVKLPWAFCLSAVFTGMYKLLKGLISTYEKINQDKRNMSAIYAISGNVANSLNEYGLYLAEDIIVDEETNSTKTVIEVSSKDLNQKKENIRWNQIMKYFEKMQQNKEEIIENDDPSKLKLVTELLNKMIDKIPKNQVAK